MSSKVQPSYPGAQAVAKSRVNLETLQFLILFSLLLFVPALIYYFVPISSQTPGLVGAAVAMLIVAAVGITPSPSGERVAGWLAMLLLIGFLVCSHAIVAMLFETVDAVRTFLSSVSLAIVLFAALPLCHALETWSAEAVERGAEMVRWMFVAIAALAIIGIQPPSSGLAISFEKSVFPFAEPSHFAIGLTPFILHAAVRRQGWLRVFWLAVGYGIALLLESMSLIVGVTLAAIICLPIWRTGLLALAFWAAITFLDLTYFTDRLDFSYQSRNLSTLIYVQGWELAWDSLNRTLGWGIGFQQLGFGVINSPTAEIIYRMLRNDSNTRDGGFVAAKLLSEFGISGLILVITYTFIAIKTGLRLRAYALARGVRNASVGVFAGSMVVGYAIEMFVRGIGYFSPGGVVMIASLLYLWRINETWWRSPAAIPAHAA